MSETGVPTTRCPRCGQVNPPPARFCAECGLNLAAADTDARADGAARRKPHAGTWLVLGLLLAGTALAVLALFARVRRHPAEHREGHIETIERHYLIVEPEDARGVDVHRHEIER